ncbi:MAG: hypothetical protein R6X25_01225 [Candidatus Krumholzibacteriia bacterium]
MNGGRIDDLINGEIDGVNGPADCDELAALLRLDPEARRRREELREAVGLLERLRPVEPPAALRGRILAAMDEAVSQGDGRGAGTMPAREALPRLLDWFRRPVPIPAFAVVAVAAVIVIAVGLRIETGPRQPASRDLLGVVLPADAPALAVFQAAAPAVRGAWRSAPHGERTLLRLDLESERPVVMSVDAGAGASWAGYVSPQPPAGGGGIDGGRIELRGLASGQHVLLLQQVSPGPITLRARITADGAVIDERVFTVGRDRRDD